MNKLRNVNTHKTVDHMGKLVDERTVVNVPFYAYYPTQPVATVHWTRSTKAKPTNNEESDSYIRKPFQISGHTLYGHYGWGSACKTGHTTLLATDIGKQSGSFKVVEDGVRFNRWMLPQGIYGAGRGKLRIKVLAWDDRLDSGHRVTDGFGYMSKALFDSIKTEHKPIHLGRAKGSYTSWQRIPWSKELAKEIGQVTLDRAMNCTDPRFLLYEQHASYAEKQALVEIDEDMIFHPHVVQALARSKGEIMVRMATTGGVKGTFRVAVPTDAPKVALPKGKWSVMRYPIDSRGSQQAVEIDDDISEKEYRRIKKSRVAQYSASNPQFNAKGCCEILDKVIVNGEEYDFVICSEDIKLSNIGVDVARQADILDFEDICIILTQLFAPGSACGVNEKWAKSLMGLDHDGDMVEISDLKNYPVYFQAIADRPYADTPKLEKTRTPLGNGGRVKMILKTMVNAVGHASNTASRTFIVKDRDILAKTIGRTSVEDLDNVLNELIKSGTDGFKTNVSLKSVIRQLEALDTNMDNAKIRVPPWLEWPNSIAFSVTIPKVILEVAEMDGEKAYLCRYSDSCEWVKKSELNDGDLKNAVWPDMYGSIAEICRITLPHMQPILEALIPVKPLSSYLRWSLPATPEEYAVAKTIQDFYNAREESVNWSDPKSVQSFKNAYAERLAEQPVNPHALWRVAHSGKGDYSSAGSVFMAFPEDCRAIVAGKPGLDETIVHTVVLGIKYQLPQINLNEEYEINVMDAEVIDKNKRLKIRRCITIDHPDLIQTSTDVPNLLGWVAERDNQPELGRYKAKFERKTKSAHFVTLTPA